MHQEARRLQGPPGTTEAPHLCREWAQPGQASTSGISERADPTASLQMGNTGRQGHTGRAPELDSRSPGPEVHDNLTLHGGAELWHGALRKTSAWSGRKSFQPKAQEHILVGRVRFGTDQLASPPPHARAFLPQY